MTGFHFGNSIEVISETVDHCKHLNFCEQGQFGLNCLRRAGGIHTERNGSNMQQIPWKGGAYRVVKCIPSKTWVLQMQIQVE
jgi:hypothetical protein